MFWFDKDMERVMLAKKKEVLQEIETAKKRVLQELYCLKRSAHSDLCSLQADYNRMALTLTNTVNEIRAELKCITDEYKSMIATTFNQYTTTIDNKLLALETFENEVIQEVNAKLSELETMSAQVEALIAEMEQIVADGVTEADLTALENRLTEMINNIDVSEELNVLAAELREEIASAGVQADWNEIDTTSKAFVQNKPFGVIADGGATLISFSTIENADNVETVRSFNSNTLASNVAQGEYTKPYLYDKRTYTYVELPGAKTSKPTIDETGEYLIAKYTSDDLSFTLHYNASTKQATTKYKNNSYEAGRYAISIGTIKTMNLTIEPAFIANSPQIFNILMIGDSGAVWSNYVPILSPNGTLYKLTVSDDGTLSATPVTE